MNDLSFTVIVILGLLAGNYIHVGIGWLVFALGIAFVMYLRRADRIRREEMENITQQPSIRRKSDD